MGNTFEIVPDVDVIDYSDPSDLEKPSAPSSKNQTPRVVHLKREPFDVRIDRQSHWGNPFVIGRDGNREQVIAKYREWIMEPDNAHMISLARKELRGKTLGCWCAPKACHGDVLLEIANG